MRDLFTARSTWTPKHWKYQSHFCPSDDWQSIKQQINHPSTQPSNNPTNQPTSQSPNNPTDQPTKRTGLEDSQLTNYSKNQTINQPMTQQPNQTLRNQPIHKPQSYQGLTTNRPANQSKCQPTNQPTKQTTYQPTNKTYSPGRIRSSTVPGTRKCFHCALTRLVWNLPTYLKQLAHLWIYPLCNEHRTLTNQTNQPKLHYLTMIDRQPIIIRDSISKAADNIPHSIYHFLFHIK